MIDRFARDICESAMNEVGGKFMVFTFADGSESALTVDMSDVCRFADLMHFSKRGTILWR
jgi:hypothetical protein